MFYYMLLYYYLISSRNFIHITRLDSNRTIENLLLVNLNSIRSIYWQTHDIKIYILNQEL